MKTARRVGLGFALGLVLASLVLGTVSWWAVVSVVCFALAIALED